MCTFQSVVCIVCITVYYCVNNVTGKLTSLKGAANYVVLSDKLRRSHQNAKWQYNTNFSTGQEQGARHLRGCLTFDHTHSLFGNKSAPHRSQNNDGGVIGKIRRRNIRHITNRKSEIITVVSELEGEDISAKRRVSSDPSSARGFEVESDANLTPDVPSANDNCTTIARFLSKRTNLKLVIQKAKDFGCRNGNLARMLQTLASINNITTSENSHRTRILRKWRHLACHLYHNFLACLKDRDPSTNDVPLPGTDKSRRVDEPTRKPALDPSREAVHVSNSSEVDFLNLMIGYDREYTDDDQMWFY